MSSELAVPGEAFRVGQGVRVDDLFQRLAEQQLLDRQFQLLAGQRARDGGHLEDIVRHVAGREGNLDAFADGRRPR